MGDPEEAVHGAKAQRTVAYTSHAAFAASKLMSQPEAGQRRQSTVTRHDTPAHKRPTLDLELPAPQLGGSEQAQLRQRARVS